MNALTPVAAPAASLDFSADSLNARIRSGAPGAISRVAKDFESLFVSLVLKEMRQTLGPGALFGGDSADVYGGLFDQFLSKHLVDAGGLGVGKMIERQLAPRDTSTRTHAPAPSPDH